jgi:hypothetical protein
MARALSVLARCDARDAVATATAAVLVAAHVDNSAPPSISRTRSPESRAGDGRTAPGTWDWRESLPPLMRAAGCASAAA